MEYFIRQLSLVGLTFGLLLFVNADPISHPLDMEVVTIVSFALVAGYLLPFLFKLLTFVVKMLQIPSPTKRSPFVLLLGHIPRMLSIQKEKNLDPSTATFTVMQEVVNDNENVQEGGVWRFWAGPVPIVIVSRAEAAEVLLKKSNLPKPIFYSLVSRPAGVVDGLIVSQGGDHWKSHRRLLTPAFHNKILDDFLPLMSRHSKLFEKDIQANASPDGILEDIYSLVARCCFGVLAESALGTSLMNGHEAHGHDYAGGKGNFDRAIHAFKVMQEVMVLRPSKPWLLIDFIYRMDESSKRMDDAMKGTLFPIVTSIYNERRKKILETMGAFPSNDMENNNDGDNGDKYTSKGKKMPFLDILIIENLKNPKTFTEKDVYDELLTFFGAGWDTISLALTWTFTLVGHHPQVQNRIFEELDLLFPSDREDDTITMDDLKDMRYIGSVIKEVLRLYPVPLLVREMIEDTVVPLGQTKKEVTIPKGAYVIISPLFIHMNSDHWTEAGKFDPDRFFVEDRCIGRNAFSYIPFSAGHRNCLGAKYAQIQMKYIIASFFKKFKVTTLTPIQDIKITAQVAIKPVSKITIRIEERKSM